MGLYPAISPWALKQGEFIFWVHDFDSLFELYTAWKKQVYLLGNYEFVLGNCKLLFVCTIKTLSITAIIRLKIKKKKKEKTRK